VEGSESVTALAEATVSRKTIYKWLGRHESEEPRAGRSQPAPHNSPLKVSAEMIAHIIERAARAGARANCFVKMAEAWPEERSIGQTVPRYCAAKA